MHALEERKPMRYPTPTRAQARSAPRIISTIRRAGVAAAVGGLLVGTLSAVGTAPVASATQTPSGARASGALSTEALRQVLQDQSLPTTELIPTTRKSHPWNGAAWQNVPIDLAKRGYVEKEYYLSGVSNVYEWIPYTGYATKVTASGPYTTRMDVRMPKDMDEWSGDVVVEIINMSAGYDWTAVWSALWQRVLKNGDVYVGITSKPNVLPGLLRFDRKRYKRLNWANPVPAEQQTCGKLPRQKRYDPNLSRLYENGLVYDVLSQAGRLLKSSDASNPLGRPATQVLLSGESQSASLLLTYYRYFSRAAQLASGQPVYDGYLAETMVDIHSDLSGLIPGDRISQCAPALPKDDPQDTTFPDRSAPWLGINSGWDYPGVRGWRAPADSDTATSRKAFWELAGSNHGWEWQYDYGDATKKDLLKAGFYDPATYAWSCTPNNPEVPFYMAEKAAYEHLQRWAAGGAAPPSAPRIKTHRTKKVDTTSYDRFGNARGGLRFPMVEVPIASFGPGQYALTGDCTDQIKPFSARVLRKLYPSRADYLKAYDRVTRALLRGGFVLKSDAKALRASARRVSSIP
jgi:hypothetical protein